MSNAPKKSIPRPGRKPASEQVAAPAPAPAANQPANGSRQIAILAAQAGLDKKATGVEIIDVMGKVDYADYLVLMTGASDRNVAAIAQEVDAALSKAGFRSMSVEGLPTAQWVLIDFVDVVVHVFQKDVRSLYDLDGLWMDAERLPVASSEPSDGADDGDRLGSDVVLPSRSRAKASKRPTKKPKTAGAKPARRGASTSASSARVAAGGRSTAGARSGSTGTRKASPGRATAATRGSATSGSGAARSSTRGASAAKATRPSKASKGQK